MSFTISRPMMPVLLGRKQAAEMVAPKKAARMRVVEARELGSSLSASHMPPAMVMNRISTVMISGMMALSRKPAPRKAEYRRMGVVPTRLTTNRAIRRKVWFCPSERR